MNTTSHRRRLWALASVLLLSFSSLVAAEPPSRAARLSYLSGTVSFSPAGQPDWVHAAVNRPLTTGDRLWTGASSRAELQIGGAAIRVGPSTSMVLLNLDNRIAQVQLSQGTLSIRVRSLGPRQTFEIATPNLAFSLRRPGEYRIEVDPQDDATAVMVRNGEAEVYGEGASYTVNSRRAYRFYGTDLSDYETLAAQRNDDLDRWSRERDRRADNSVSARYVSSEVVGYEDLDANGSWRVDTTYGPVWTPTRVASGWTPYRNGHWSWVDPWGWTWVDDAPWGYAVSHYGRWANINNTWAWVPGPRRERAVYAPALVAFIGGKNFQISVSAGGMSAANVGWFPLAPREVYQPSYPVSRTYFDSINRSNAVIAPTTITNVYNTTIVNNTTNVTNITNVVYANQRVTGAVVVVPAQAFVQSLPVAKATVNLPREAFIAAPLMRVASVAPVRQSVQGGASEAATKPPLREHAIVARTAPPPAPLPFADQQTQLAARPGTPIDEAQRTRLKPAAPAVVAPKVSVVATAPAPTATTLPPVKAPGAKSPEARKAEAAKADGRRGESHRSDADKAAVASAGAAGAEAGRAEAGKVDAAKAAGAKANEAKAAAAKAETVKADATKAEAMKGDAARAAAARAEAAKAGTAQAAAANAAKAAAAITADAAKAAEAKADAARAEAARADAAKDAKAANAKAEAAKAGEARAEQARGNGAKAEAMKAEAARVAAARAEAAKADAARAEAARADAAKDAKAANAKAEAAKAGEARAEQARGNAAKAEAMKAEAARAAAARAEAAKADAARAEAAQADAAKDAKGANAKAEAAKAGEARAEQARGNAAKAEAMKAEAARAAAARAEAAKADAARAEAARADAAKDAKAVNVKAEAAKAGEARAERARGDAAKAETMKTEATRAEAATADAARAAAAKAGQAKAEAARADAAKKSPAAAPESPASGPKADADATPEGEKTKKNGRKP